MGTPTSYLLVLFLTPVLLLVPASVAEEAPAGRIGFQYGLGSAAEGALSGSCAGRAVVWGSQAASLAVASPRPLLRVYETVVTSTMLATPAGPAVLVDRHAEQGWRDLEPSPGTLRVAWETDARILLLEHGAFLDTAPPFRVDFTAAAAGTGPVVANHPLGSFWVDRGEGVLESYAGLRGWGRSVDLDASRAAVTGDTTLYLEHARVTGPGFDEELPPYRAEEVSSGPGVVTSRERFHHALLHLPSVALETPLDDARLICSQTALDIVGTFTAYDATGRAWSRGEEVSFERRELTLLGDFHLDESPGPGDPATDGRTTVASQGAGMFEAVGLDFAWIQPPGAGLEAGRVAAGVAAAAAIGYGAWKLATFLFTRLRTDELLEQDARRRIHDAIQANPGIGVLALCQLTSMSSTNVRYHLAVLRRHGRIRGFKLQGSWRYAVMASDMQELRRRSLLESDPRLQKLVDLVGRDPVPAARLVRSMRTEWGLSRSGSWQLIDRAAAANLVQKEREGAKVMLRCPQ